MRKNLLLVLFTLSFLTTKAQTFYDESTIQTIDIVFSQTNWDALLDAAEATDAYTAAQSITINGVIFNNVGVKYKGNSSYNPNQVKNPLHIELDTYSNQDYQGYTDIKLSNVFADPSFVREVLAYKLLRNYMHAPLANFAKVTINGTFIGLYTNVESISKKFVKNHFGSNDNAFFDCSPPGGAGPTTTTLPSLQYLGASSTSYTSAYDMKSVAGWDELIALTNTLSTTTTANTASLEALLDVDRAIWMLAFDNVFVNLDSYIGKFKQNYYLYKDDNGRFDPIIWDLNMSFGVFSDTGSTNLNSTTAKRQLTHTLHATDAGWPLVQKLLGVPRYKKMYLAHYKTILTEMVSSGLYLTNAQSLQSLISSTVATDTNKFNYQSNITTNINTDVSVGMQNAPGLSNLMSGRNTYLTALSDFTNQQPVISTITLSNNAPSIGSSVTVKATVTNRDYVMLGYRTAVLDVFTKVEMFDDGAHNDGAAGDNVYGVSVPITDIDTQYYIYAENTNIGAFSPARAEHEFHHITGTYPTIAPGVLVVNEIMAQNTSTITDPDGSYSDWFELYNNSSEVISLDYLYASDSSTSLLKWQFPSGITMQPNSYLIVWADQSLSQTGIHADFKFSAAGEKCILSYPNGVVVDTVTFGVQTANMGYARNPNGTGDFVIQAPTFNANNQSLSNPDFTKEASISVYPNPTQDKTTLLLDAISEADSVKIYNQLGQLIFETKAAKEITIDCSNFQSGTYLLKCNSIYKKIIKL